MNYRMIELLALNRIVDLYCSSHKSKRDTIEQYPFLPTVGGHGTHKLLCIYIN
jgi:hypothetical protein